jgi:HD-GYP domain-containing protein (c-di-GMP phosphodiesterase class II)
MFDVTLSHPISTLENRLLLRAGSQLTEEILDDLISQSGKVSYQQHSLLKYGSIKKDILHFITSPPYDVIFSDQRSIEGLLNNMENIHVIPPVLQSLDYFRQEDFYTYSHIMNVFALCSLLSGVMISDHELRKKEIASGPVHDFGKVNIPLHILKKSSPLSKEERKYLEHHSNAGYVLLSYYYRDTESIFAVVARDHHERADGSGYPRGIKLKDHVVEIIAVCDVYDALISSRPYRTDAYDNRTAIEELSALGEKDILNSEVIKALVSFNRKEKKHYSDCKVSNEKRGVPPQNNNYGIIADEEE